MTQTERLSYLIRYLMSENRDVRSIPIPADLSEQKHLLRSLLNVRPPEPVPDGFLEVQDAYLQEECARKGVVSLADLKPIRPGIYLWRGDITRLSADAIVNAANHAMLGCFYPCHGCIDNQIHTFSGVQLRLACDAQMKAQGHEEPAGRAKITPAYNLPCRFVLHTVGPVIQNEVTQEEENTLASCYRSCLELAEENHLASIAFCCISTGEFRFPNERAARIAVRTVKEYRRKTHSKIEVVFNVFKQIDYDIYRSLFLGA